LLDQQSIRKGTRREHLTERRIAALAVPTKRTKLYDTKEPALGLKLEVSGKRTFFWFRAVNNKPLWVTIGPWPDIDLDTARKKAEEHNVALATWQKDGSVGPNPFERVRPSRQLTLGMLIDDYIQRHIMLGSSNPALAAKENRNMANRHLSHWKDRRLGSITRKDVNDLQKELGETKGKIIANRVCQFVKRLFYYAMGDAALWNGANPAARFKKFDEPKRTRFLQPEEFIKFEKALTASENRDLRHFIMLALATGARKSKVHSMRKNEINFDTLTWELKRAKNQRSKNWTPQLVNLKPIAVAIIKERIANSDPENPWVFPSAESKTGHVGDFKKQWKKLLIRAGLYHPNDPDLRLTQHDLRRTFASYMAIAGASLPQIGDALGHLDPASTMVYARLHQDSVRNAMAAGDREMAAMVKKAKKRLKQLPTRKQPKQLAASV
jgi:integrase